MTCLLKKLYEIQRHIYLLQSFKGCQKGIIWLQTRYILTNTGKIIKKPNRSRITKYRRKLKKMYKKGIPIEDINQSYDSWMGNIKKLNAYEVIKNMNKLKKELDNDYSRNN